MDVFLSEEHIDMLCKLKQIVEKHGCYINFGVVQNNIVDDLDVIKNFKGYTEEIWDELIEKGGFSEVRRDLTDYWFGLYNLNTNDLNLQRQYLSYYNGFMIVTYKEDSLNTLSEEAIEFLESNMPYDDCYCTGEDNELYAPLEGTKIKGFDNLEHPEVYQEGVALKCFADLVCDYFGEERIKEDN